MSRPKNEQGPGWITVEEALRQLDRFPRKSFWNGGQQEGTWDFYCPLCHIARRLPNRARTTARHGVQVTVAAAFVALLTWNWLGWKGIVSWFPLWIGFEVIYRTKVRASLSCRNCGFDPCLYLVDIKRARTEVEQHWRRKYAEKGIPFPEKNQLTALSNPSASGSLHPSASGSGAASPLTPDNNLET